MTLLDRKEPMTIEAFLAFTETRPDEERWELIDGEPVLNASPTRNHQKIVGNLIYECELIARHGSGWEVLPGIGVRLSETSMPIPDVLIRPRDRKAGHFCDDMIVAFEVLSPSSRSRDLRWKRQAYANLPALQHYLVLHQDQAVAQCFDRARGWAERRFDSETGIVELPAVNLHLVVDALYRDTGL